MRTQKILSALVFFLVFTAWATSAKASCYANFSGNCNRPGWTGPAYCAFDGNRTYTYDTTPTSCGSSSVSMVLWDYGDGTTPVWGGLYSAHTFSDPAAIDNDSVIRMTMWCADGCTAYKDRYALFIVIGCPGCLQTNNGWN